MDKRLSAVVTGGGSGIGLSLTEAFVDSGYHVIVGGRKERGIESKFPGRATFVPGDARLESSHWKWAEAAAENTGKLDVYVNNAGFSSWRPIREIDRDFLNSILETNLAGYFWGCKAAAGSMRNGGVIVNVSSIAGKRGSANNSAYVASKFGVNGMTQSLAKELGPEGIRVNAICPVLVETDGLKSALEEPYSPAAKEGVDSFFSDFATTHSAFGRLPSSAEVAAFCVFLASRNASAITGQCINVDCGVFPQ